jgi:hypothetical protein
MKSIDFKATEKYVKLNNELFWLKGLSYIKINKYEKEFLDYFDNDLKKYIKEITNDEKEFIRGLKYVFSRNVRSFDVFKEKYEKFGKLPIWRKHNLGWLDEDLGMMRAVTKGVKRPEHSKIMKKKMKIIANNRTEEHKENLNIFLKSEWFFKRVISLNLIKEEEREKYNLEDVKKLYAEWNSKNNKTDEHKERKIGNFIKNKKYLDKEEHKEFIITYKKLNTKDAYSIMLSLISTWTINDDANNKGSTKFFKTGYVNVKNCLNKTIIKYRSSWELEAIEFFEKHNVKYEYEPFYIKKKNGRLYLPDFLLYLEESFGKNVLFELKGFIRGKEGIKNEELKKEGAIEYCKKNNLIYVYLREKINNFEQLKNNILWA